MSNLEHDAKKEKDKEYSFYVDADLYQTESKSLTGAQIKAQAGVTPTYQLFLEEEGDKPDKPISDDESINMKKGGKARHFYAVPPATFGTR